MSSPPPRPPSSKWWSASTIAVVTGANKGVGLEIVRQLALQGLTVILTSRDRSRGLQATQSLQSQGLSNVVFHQLDIGNPESRTAFAEWVQGAYGGLDILVNNAAVFHNTVVYEDAVETMRVNYRGTVELTELLLPLLRGSSAAGARVVNVSSIVGRLINVNNEELKKKLSDAAQYDQTFIDKLEQEYLEACRAGNGEAQKYANSSYRFSKTLLNAYGRLLSRRLASQPQGRTIHFHNVHPGFVLTGMHRKAMQNLDEEAYQQQLASGRFEEDGAVTVEDGADTAVWLCLLPPGDQPPSGLFWSKRQEISY